MHSTDYFLEYNLQLNSTFSLKILLNYSHRISHYPDEDLQPDLFEFPYVFCFVFVKLHQPNQFGDLLDIHDLLSHLFNNLNFKLDK